MDKFDDNIAQAANQLFCIYSDNDTEDPFEIEDENLPFLGVILISINKIDKSFKEVLNESIDKLSVDMRSISKNKLYKTLNCADICIALRTGKMRDIYNTVMLVKKFFSGNDISANISTIQCVTFDPDSISTNKDLLDFNRAVMFDLRFQNPPKFGCKGYGILGLGGVTARIDFEAYFKNVYPQFITNKQSETGEIDIVNERIIYEITGEEYCVSKRNNNNETYNKYIKSLNDKLKNINREFQEKAENIPPTYKYKFEEEHMFLSELVKVFADMGFQYTEINGYIFCVQIGLVLEECDNIIKNYIAKDPRKWCKVLIKNMHKAAVCINNYNSMLQFLSLDSVNVPTHRFQAKINTEKYISAYTGYLQKLCISFNEQYNEKNDRKRVLPITLLDLDAERISAYTLFDGVSNEGDRRMNLYAVVFPNYKRFANIRHILPVLTHELSHEFRYMDRQERNEMLIKYILKGISKELTERLIKEAEINIYTISGIKDILSDKLEDILYEEIKEENKFFEMSGYEIVDAMEEWLYKNLFFFCNKSTLTFSELESRISSNSMVLKNHLQSICRWIVDKKIQQKKSLIEIDMDMDLFNDVLLCLSENKEVTNEKLKKIITILYDQCDVILKSTYEDIYHDFLLYICNKMNREYKNIPFESLGFLMREIKNFRMEEHIKDSQMLLDFCNDIIEITMNIAEIVEVASVLNDSAIEDSNILKNIFDKLKDFVNNETSNLDIFIRMGNSRNIFTTLGLYNDDSKAFEKILKKILFGLKPHIKNILYDRRRSYSEICADLGMCAAFELTAFGYLRFLSHIFSQESDDFWEWRNSFTTDRVLRVLYVLLSSDDEKNKKQAFYENKQSFLESIKNYTKELDVNNQDALINQKMLLQFFKYLNVSNLQYLEQNMELDHFNKLYNKYIKKSNWVELCKKDETVILIGEHYNETEPKTVEKSKKLFFEHQMSFVNEYYCYYKDLYNGLVKQILKKSDDTLSIEDCIDVLYKKEN